jgi:MFS transporter, DHA1 family, solute carrier family 18 (vesicular amine transporter), member 1/2
MARLSPKLSVLVVVGLALFTDTAVYAMLPPLLPEYARLHGLSQTRLGLLFGCYAAALLLAALPLGTWADRRGRRGPFLGGLIGFGAATILFAFAGSFPLLLVARVLQGIAAAATWVAGLAMLADHYPAGQRGKAMSTVFACANVGLLLGPTFSGWMVRLWSIRAAFLFAAGLAVLDALVRVTLLPPDPPAKPSGTGYLGLLRDGTVRRFAGAMVMGSALGAVLEAVLPLHLSRHLGMDSVAIGLAFTLAALASTFTSPLVGHWTDRAGAAPPLRLGLVLATALLAVAVFIPSRTGVYAYMLVMGGTCSLLMSPTGPALAGHVEGKGGTDFGSVFSLLNIAFSLGLMLGPILGSALTDLVGLKPAMGVLAACFTLYLVPLAGGLRKPDIIS